MRPGADSERGLEELVSLWTADSADKLQRILVLHGCVRESADSFEPIALLTKHHATEPGTSAATALLLLTDRRWRGGVGQLVRRIAESGMLSDQDLDVLAHSFLDRGNYAGWPVPEEWFSEDSVTIVLDDASDAQDEDFDEAVEEVAAGEAPAVAARGIAPPLRRWASARLLAREPAAWPEFLARAQELDTRHGASVLMGMFDGIVAVSAVDQALLVTTGTTWPHQQVRRAALELVAARDGADAAVRLAQADPNAKIRAWATTLGHPKSAPPQMQVNDSPDEQGWPHSNDEQAALF